MKLLTIIWSGSPASGIIEEFPACRYRKWSIAEDIDLVVRCELDGVMKYKGQDQLLLIKALNEYDAKSSGNLVMHTMYDKCLTAHQLQSHCSATSRFTGSGHVKRTRLMHMGRFVSLRLLCTKVTDAAGISWRQKLETQRGAVLANELKNNANKLAKWTAAAHISGTDMIKLGYVTRATPKDNFNHVILGTQVSIVLCSVKIL